MKNRKVLITLLVIVLGISLFFLTGCGNKKEEEIAKTTTTDVGNSETTEATNANKTANLSTEGFEYDYKEGVLTQIVDEDGNPKQTDFAIDGIILVGNRHSYEGVDPDSEGLMNKLAAKGYKKEGINSSFYLNEWIEFYIDTKYSGSESNVKILAVPHKTIEEYQKMKSTQLTELAEEKGFVLDYQKPDAEANKYVGENYISQDYPEGKYDILFMYKGNLAYFINVSLTKEIEE